VSVRLSGQGHQYPHVTLRRPRESQLLQRRQRGQLVRIQHQSADVRHPPCTTVHWE